MSRGELPEWIRQMSQIPIAFVAPWLGMKLEGRALSSWCFGPCPSCSAVTRHKGRRDKRGAIGVSKSKPAGWRCMDCQQGGGALDLVSWQIGGARYRDLRREQKDRVRAWCEQLLGVQRDAGTPAPVRYPGEVACRTMLSDWCSDGFEANTPEHGYLVSRGIDPERALKLCKPLRPKVERPGWARFGGRDWHEGGFRLIFPLYDAQGRMQSVLARNVIGGKPKSVPPLGYNRGGLVLADTLGAQLLLVGTRPDWWPKHEDLRVVIAEGEIDFLTWATRWNEADEVSPITFGIFSGSWTMKLADRIPDSSTVVIATHNDEAGDAYASDIARTFANRSVQLKRWHATGASHG